MLRSLPRPVLEARERRDPVLVVLAPVAALMLTLLTGALLFGALGYDPLKALAVFFLSPLTSGYGLAELTLKATPLTLCAIGLALGFRGNVWNIGAEGQFVFGAVCGGGTALWLPGLEAWQLLPLMAAAGVLGGMAWAAVPALLKTRFHTSEILVSLMLTYVAELFLSWLVYGPWRDPEGYNFPLSRMFEDAALLPVLFEGTRLHAGCLVAAAVALIAWFVFARTFIGFQIKVIGLTPAAGGYAGFSHPRIVWLSFLVSGGLAGLAGLFEVAGPIGQLQPSVSPGYGFTAIIVAFLGRLHPLGIVLAAFLMALTFLGGEAVQIGLGLPLAISGVFQGLILFYLLASDVFVRHRLRFVRLPAARAAS